MAGSVAYFHRGSSRLNRCEVTRAQDGRRSDTACPGLIAIAVYADMAAPSNMDL
jgi:hypothetical protein